MADNRIDRSAFLYLEPSADSYGNPEDYAQCKTCYSFMGDERKRCYIIGKDFEVLGAHTCAVYINGEPETFRAGTEKELITLRDAGFERRAVRCQNCYWFTDLSLCGLFAKLNMKDPSHFNLDPVVSKHGCCNAQTPVNAQFKEKDFFEILNQRLTLKEFFKK